MGWHDRFASSSQWWRCTNDDCAVMWDVQGNIPCWACGSPAVRTIQPAINSTNGMIVYRIPNVRGMVDD